MTDQIYKHTAQEVRDAGVRAEAIDPTQSFIVQAPAGSGKTELLMQRYLTLLARVQAPEEIIAITFTKKATGEMRERILKALDSANSGEVPEAEHARKTWSLARAVLEHDKELDWQLRSNPNRLRIFTIDALCGSIARQMPTVSGLGVTPAVNPDTSEAYRAAARSTLRNLSRSDAVKTLLAHLDNNWLRLEDMLINLLMRRDHWLRHLPAESNIDSQRSVLEQSLADVIHDSLQQIDQAIPNSLKEEWSRLANIAGANLRRDGDSGALSLLADQQSWPPVQADQLALWRGLLDLVLTASGDFRKSLSKKIGFPAPSSVKNKEEKAEMEALKADALDLIESLRSTHGLLETILPIRVLPDPTYSDDQWSVLRALFSVLKLAVAHLQVVFAQQAQVDFTEISLAALQALGDEQNPSDLALALDYRIQHILVDEFQDTSVSQYTLLEQLTQGWQADDGRSLFLVGDPMQSIYRFREAEVGLFLNVQKHQRLGQVPITPLRLCVNFRSTPGVVDWVNRTFQRAMPEQDAITEGAVHYSPSDAFHLDHNEQAVQVHAVFAGEDNPHESRSEEAQQVADLAQAALTRNESVAVLVRSRNHLSEIIPTLRDRGLPFQAVEIESLSQRPVIRDLTALTRALIHQADRIACLSVLRAPWCGLRLCHLENLTARSDRALFDVIRDKEILAQFEEPIRKRIQHVSLCFEQAERTRLRMPFAHWVEQTWRNLGGPSCLQEAVDHDNARRFFDLLAELEVSRDLPDLTQLDQAVNQLFAQTPPTQGACVQLMTIHKSKGLEFDTVILPGLQQQTQNDQAQLLQWTEWRNTDEDREALLLAPIPPAGEAKDPINLYLQALDKTRALHEKTRLLYVAATRAKHQLHLLTRLTLNDANEIKRVDSRSLLSAIWPSLEVTCHQQLSELTETDQATNSEKETLEKVTPHILRLPDHFYDQVSHDADDVIKASNKFSNQALSDQTQNEADQSNSPDDYFVRSRHIGIVVHRCLQQVGERVARGEAFAPVLNELINQKKLFRVLLLESGLNPEECDHAIESVIEALNKVKDDPHAQWIWSSTHRDIQSEYPMSSIGQSVKNEKGQLLQNFVDLTFIDENDQRWIVDFKSSIRRQDESEAEFFARKKIEYFDQLENYARLFSEQENRSVQLALYFPMIAAWHNWSYQME